MCMIDWNLLLLCLGVTRFCVCVCLSLSVCVLRVCLCVYCLLELYAVL